jgi:hypothetical protein
VTDDVEQFRPDLVRFHAKNRVKERTS